MYIFNNNNIKYLQGWEVSNLYLIGDISTHSKWVMAGEVLVHSYWIMYSYTSWSTVIYAHIYIYLGPHL